MKFTEQTRILNNHLILTVLTGKFQLTGQLTMPFSFTRYLRQSGRHPFISKY